MSETGKKKRSDRDFQSCGITAPPPASACPYLVAASRHRYGPELQTETMNRFQTWPSRRGSGRSPRRSRSAPLREHPWAKAQPGRGGPLACPAPGLRRSLAEAVRSPAPHSTNRTGAAGQRRLPRSQARAHSQAESRLAHRNRFVAIPPSHRSGQRPAASGLPVAAAPHSPASASSLHPGPAAPGQQNSARPRPPRLVRVEREDNAPCKRAAWLVYKQRGGFLSPSSTS